MILIKKHLTDWCETLERIVHPKPAPNQRIQRSAASEFLIIPSVLCAAPADAERYTSSENSEVKIRRAKPRQHNLASVHLQGQCSGKMCRLGGRLRATARLM